ncbi:MAG TPA: PRC-barrel domain-containing protein [Candidatus Dormibacteraeota bacterium]|jgi:sporulation protein YlmC with PRC-barrel domain|nr:PRC-barrel domain-containing protein [Candidatus Dormibacteraeota bacterium]
MPDLADFRLGADVVDSDGNKAGTLVSVIVDEKGFEPRALVVKDEATLAGRLLAGEKLFTTDEVVIPITAVESATHEAVRLSISGPDIRRQPLYLTYRREPMTVEEAALEEGEFLTGGLGLPKADEIANKPEGEIEIDRGENVMLGTTGRRLGRVDDVLFDHGKLVGVVIRPEGFFKRDVVLPMSFINRADDMALFADLNESDIEQLKPFVDPGPPR